MRTAFKLLVHESDGQRYEDLFVKIMSYSDPDFQPIKAYGNIGDRGNDGWVAKKGRYYQSYAPESLAKNTKSALSKLSEDFEKLKRFWNYLSPVREFYFVVNDKFKGVSPHIYEAVDKLKHLHDLDRSEVFLASQLENKLFSLEHDQIKQVLNSFEPSPPAHSLKVVDFYEVIDEDEDNQKDRDDLATEVELKLRNSGSEVAFVKEISIHTVKHWNLVTDRNHRIVDVSATYDISLSEKAGSVAKKKIHHELKPQETDRIRFKLHSKFWADPDGLSLYLIEINVHFNEETAPATSRQTIVNVRPSHISQGSYFGGYSPETVTNNKALAREVLELHAGGVGVEDYVVGALESWMLAPDTP
ncbi:hypothetical protein WBQ28_18450 [Pseudomonas syringae pv. syringae]|uniref:hypothetical protein n=1 Tax=Pseudomonas TaxID=286 RepID=UPI000CDA1EF4|nr:MULTISPECIES: hypothetical protein [Pseudomonas]POP71224.1 hypothetical protein CXB35_06195 [Pseudomonas syringae]